MNAELHQSLTEAGVRDEIISILKDEELDTFDLLHETSDELLKSCEIKGGQIVRIRKALANHVHQAEEQITPLKDLPSRSLSSLSDGCLSDTASSLLPTLSCSETPPSTPSTSTTEQFGPSPFSIKETSRSPTLLWTRNFKLPESYSPSVNAALKAGNLSGNLRNEFTRDICAAVRVHTLNPSKTEREKVAHMIVGKFPFLADSIGSGIGSWQAAMNHRFKNLRKTKRDPENKATLTTTSVQSAAAPPAKKKFRTADVPPLPEGETKETCEEHKKSMAKELAKKSNRDMLQIRELMEITFPYRRQCILSDPSRVDALLEGYPALQLISEIKAEFGRIVGVRGIVKTMIELFSAVQPKLLEVATKSSCKRSRMVLADMENLISEEMGKRSAIESTAAVVMLSLLLKEKGSENAVIKICSDDESIDESVQNTEYPRIVGSGSLARLDPLYLVAEGNIVITLGNGNVTLALALLLGIYYIFNIQYPPYARNVFAFLEASLLDNTGEAKKRISVQKLLKDISEA